MTRPFYRYLYRWNWLKSNIGKVIFFIKCHLVISFFDHNSAKCWPALIVLTWNHLRSNVGFCIWNRCFFIKICLYLNKKLNKFNNQNIGYRYLWLFSIFLITGGLLPNTTARPLRLTIRRSNFWPLRKNWTAVLKVRAASIEIISNQKELRVMNTAREVARPIKYFPNIF